MHRYVDICYRVVILVGDKIQIRDNFDKISASRKEYKWDIVRKDASISLQV